MQIATATEPRDEDVVVAASRFSFVLTKELPLLRVADQWWGPEVHRCRSCGGSAEAYAWVEPFLPRGLIEREQLQIVTNEWGPLQAVALAKALRERIRTCRMHKQPHEQLLHALYGACVLADFVEALRIEGHQPEEMTRHVDINDLRAVEIDYRSLGYLCIESLGKIDRQWLVEAFGEPAGHQSVDAAFPAPWQNAVSRCYWAAYRDACETMRSADVPLPTLHEWLHERVKSTFAWHKDWEKRRADRVTWDAEVRAALGAAWLASTKRFIVADVQTAGRNVTDDEIAELAAFRISPTGEVMDEFNARIRSDGAPSAAISKLSSIDTHGRPDETAAKVTADFLNFVGEDPVFLHNAPLGALYLKKAAARIGKNFNNPSYDTLTLARAAWPQLGRYDLAFVAAHLAVPSASPSALSNVKTTLAVLLAARKVAAPIPFYGATEREPSLHRAPARDFFAPLPLSGEHVS